MKPRFWIRLVAAFCCGINGTVMGDYTLITNCCPVAGGFMVEWVSGEEVMVKWSPDLVFTPFINLSVELPSTQSCYTDTVHSADNKCFYRVERLWPEGMVLIPGGTNIGTNPLGTGEEYASGYPQTYSLTVSAFYMDRTEITKAKWDTVYNWALQHGYQFDNAGWGKASNHPVFMVTWSDCVKWCNARSQMENKIPCYTVDGGTYSTGQSEPDCNFSANGYRLPTATEWEYAARGGDSSRRFPWGDTINHDNANYSAVGSGFSYDTSPYTTSTYHPTYAEGDGPYTSPVGSFSANGYGLYDMSGNVWEWCNDWNPGREGSSRVVRGGCWASHASFCRPARRNGYDPNGWSYYFGFRAVLAAH